MHTHIHMCVRMHARIYKCLMFFNLLLYIIHYINVRNVRKMKENFTAIRFSLDKVLCHNSM